MMMKVKIFGAYTLKMLFLKEKLEFCYDLGVTRFITMFIIGFLAML